MNDELFQEYLDRGIEAVNRLADVVERLVNEPMVELEAPPPICPHCRTINPHILISETEGKGPIIEFVLRATCLNCKKVIWGVPASWLLAKDRTETAVIIEKMKERIMGNARERNS